MAIEDVTRNDLEQMFENLEERLGKKFDQIDQRFDRVDEHFDEVHERFDRFEKQTHEDILTLFQEVERIKRHVGLKDKVEA